VSRRPGGYPGQIPGQERRGRRNPARVPGEPKGNGLDHEPGRVIDVVAGKRHLAAIEGMVALADAAVPFYQRGGELVRPVRLPAKDAYENDIYVPGLLNVRAPMVAHELGGCARWRRYTAEGEERTIDPPKEVVEQILGALVHKWPFPPLKGVIATQTMRMDGSLLLDAGYDPQTGLYLMDPPAMPGIPEAPSRADAEAASDLLESLLGEFPFADEPSASVAVSMLMTPVLRAALAPAVPIHVASAPTAGTGKSFLADLASALAIGERCPVFAAAAEPKETEKRLEGAALDGFPIIALDNLNGELAGNFLAQLGSSATLAIRAMGGHPITKVANTFTVFANGNNISAPQDLVRRTIRCGLDADMERPWERTFKADPVETVLAGRGPYVAAVLTIARAYVVAGMPGRKRPPAGFQRWSDVVRSALCWLGWPDPCESAAVVSAEDDRGHERSALFTTWDAILGGGKYTAADIARVANATSDHPLHGEFREAIIAIADPKNNQTISTKSLGRYLKNNTNVRVGALKLTMDDSDERRRKYCLRPSDPPPFS
jgi:putative DNA primase/helicase